MRVQWLFDIMRWCTWSVGVGVQVWMCRCVGAVLPYRIEQVVGAWNRVGKGQDMTKDPFYSHKPIACLSLSNRQCAALGFMPHFAFVTACLGPLHT